jgi:hypothetical protein
MFNIFVLFEMSQSHHKLYASFKPLLLRIFLSRRVRRLTKAMILILLDSARIVRFLNTLTKPSSKSQNLSVLNCQSNSSYTSQRAPFLLKICFI